MRLWVGLAIGLAIMASSADAQDLPDEIAQPYVAYTEALGADDIETARAHARRAWQAAEQLDHDAETTAILASNYAQAASALGDHAEAQRAYERAAELKEAAGGTADILAEAWIFAAGSALADAEYTDAFRHADRAASLAQTLDAGEQERRPRVLFAGQAIQAYALWLEGRVRSAGIRAHAALEVADAHELAGSHYLGLMNFVAGTMAAMERNHSNAAFYLTRAYAYMPDSRDMLGIWVSHVRSNLTDSELNDLLARIEAANLPDHSAVADDLATVAFEESETRIDARAVRRAPPQYPTDAAQAGLEGIALLRFSVNEEGRVVDPEVVLSVPVREFGEAGLRALRRWRYEPATQDGEPIRRDGLVTQFEYRLY